MGKYKKLYSRIVYLIVAGLLIAVYCCNMPKVPTLMELPDESGYLWNAAYFGGIDWDDLAQSAYYGYGYSIFLVPILKFSTSGSALIKGAYVVNILFVLGLYIVFALLLKNFFDRYSIWGAIIAGISCLTPYLFVSSYKVICENCLTFFSSLLILLFYYCLKTRKLCFYFSSVLIAAFIPFIHTRGIVVSGTFFLFSLCDILLKRKINYKRIIVVLSTFFCACLVLYLIKKSNLDFRNTVGTKNEYPQNSVNLITSNYLKERLLRIINLGIWNYLGSFASKLFYATVSTGGLALLGVINSGYMISRIFYPKDNENSILNEKEYAKSITFLLIITNFFMVIIASVFNSIGGNFQYIYYGRYYEYVIPMMLCGSLCLIFSDNYYSKAKIYIISAIITLFLGLMSYSWVNSYLDEIVMSIDTARTAAFSTAIKLHSKYIDVICYSCLISTMVILISLLVYRARKTRVILIILLGVVFWNMDRTCVETINNTAVRVEADYTIYNYLIENIDQQKIYAINDHSYKYEDVIQKVQVLIKDYRVHEINYYANEEDLLDQIETGDYVIVYRSNILNLEEKRDYTKIIEGATFMLYQKE